VLSIIAALFFPKFHWWHAEKTVRKLISEGKANEFVGKSVLVLGETSIRGETSGRITEVGYDKVDRIVYDDERYYIYIGSLTAFIVPFRAFANEPQKDEFFGLLKSKSAE
jgi:hypothetical protein